MAFDRSLIEKYEAGGEQLAQAIRGLTRADLLATPPAGKDVGKWTIQQVVIHLMDADGIGADRIKRLIAEDQPHVFGYDENRYVDRLFYNEQSADDAVTIFKLTRKNFAQVLRKLPDEAFDRSGTHSETGPISVGSQIKKYIEHLEHHLRFIHAKRAAMGKAAGT